MVISDIHRIIIFTSTKSDVLKAFIKKTFPFSDSGCHGSQINILFVCLVLNDASTLVGH